MPSLPGDAAATASPPADRTPYVLCLLVGLGGLFTGVTEPLISAFVPPLVRDALGDRPAVIGTVMAIDNVVLLLLVPWAGAASDRARAGGRGRLPIILTGLLLASAAMVLLPWAARLGIAGLVAVMVVLFAGIDMQRSPFQALIADLVPSRHRSLAMGSVTFQMCAGAIVLLALAGARGMQPAFLTAAGIVVAITAAFALGLHEPVSSMPRSARAAVPSLVDAAWSAVRGAIPGIRAIFVATFLLQLTFQTFTTWYALHGTERFGIRPEDVTVGFIAWAIGGAIGALPAGLIGVRVGRRNAMLLGFTLMTLCALALDRVSRVGLATPLLVVASASWALPTVNAYPLFVEPLPRRQRGALAAAFLLCSAFGGAIGDPLNGSLFDLAGSYRPLFLLMAGYTTLAFVAVLFVPRGAGEADTGPDSPGEASGV